MDAIERVIPEGMARLNVTFAGSNGDLIDPVDYNATDGDVRAWASEAIRTGGIPGIAAQEADLTNFVVDRFPENEVRPYKLLQLRPKTPFGQF